MVGLDMEHRVTTSMILQPKLGVLLEQLAEVWVQICQKSHQQGKTSSSVTWCLNRPYSRGVVRGLEFSENRQMISCTGLMALQCPEGILHGQGGIQATREVTRIVAT